MPIDQNILYEILAQIALLTDVTTYKNLSKLYMRETGEWYEPHGSWEVPLGELNNSLYQLGWPPLSTVVVLNGTCEPGVGYWGSCPNIPTRPRNDLDRITEYTKILKLVQKAPWPPLYPTKSPS